MNYFWFILIVAKSNNMCVLVISIAIRWFLNFSILNCTMKQLRDLNSSKSRYFFCAKQAFSSPRVEHVDFLSHIDFDVPNANRKFSGIFYTPYVICSYSNRRNSNRNRKCHQKQSTVRCLCYCRRSTDQNESTIQQLDSYCISLSWTEF